MIKDILEHYYARNTNGPHLKKCRWFRFKWWFFY